MAGLRTTIYKVADLSAARDWYADMLGTAPYFDEPFYVGFSVGGYELGLVQDPAPAARKGDNVVTYWAVDDVPAALTRLLDLGATAHEGARNVGGAIIVGSVRDPWGNVYGVIDNPEFALE